MRWAKSQNENRKSISGDGAWNLKRKITISILKFLTESSKTNGYVEKEMARRWFTLCLCLLFSFHRTLLMHSVCLITNWKLIHPLLLTWCQTYDEWVINLICRKRKKSPTEWSANKWHWFIPKPYEAHATGGFPKAFFPEKRRLSSAKNWSRNESLWKSPPAIDFSAAFQSTSLGDFESSTQTRRTSADSNYHFLLRFFG